MELYLKKYDKKKDFYFYCFLVIKHNYFWIPFVCFNKHVYGEYFVSPRGETLLSGMYGITLPDGDFVEHTMVIYIAQNRAFYAMGSLERHISAWIGSKHI